MARMLFIVAREQPELIEFLRQDFAAEEAEGIVEIFIDRRQDPEREGIQRPESEEHRRDQSRNADVARAFRDLGCAFVRQQATPSS